MTKYFTVVIPKFDNEPIEMMFLSEEEASEFNEKLEFVSQVVYKKGYKLDIRR